MLVTFLSTDAQVIEFSNTEWQDPEIFEIGQNPPHSFLYSYSEFENALRNGKAECTNVILLNGSWPFKLVEKPGEVPDGFWDPAFEVDDWEEIRVPSNWQMKGYGHAKFRNVSLSFESDPPFIPEYYNPVGCYRRNFSLPETWSNKEIMLRFEGVKSAFYLWVNGSRVGYNEGGFEPAEFTITPYLKKEDNIVALQVLEYCDGSYLENQDMWRLSGIYRDVILYAKPAIYLFDDYVITDLDDAYKDATLEIEAILRNTLDTDSEIEIRVHLFEAQSRSLQKGFPISIKLEMAGNSLDTLHLKQTITNPLKWSAEKPNLYILVYEVLDEAGQTWEVLSRKFGFREIEYTDHLLTINGRPLKLNGVNSHMHHPEHGQAVPLDVLRRDLVLMKQFNINCARTSHYPPSPEYLELADEIGIYIVDEVNDEAHSNIALSADSAWTAMYRDRTRKLVYRDRNHPSVIIWSAGNESGSGFNIAEVIRTGKEIDRSRPAWMYGGNTFYIPFEDLVGPRYWIPSEVKMLAEGKRLPGNDMRASFMDEYLAATGNGMGGLDEYWELIREYPRLTGGAIWDWVSPGITTPLWKVPDRSIHKNDGAIFGRPVFHEGPYGRGLGFSGHDEWIEFYRDPDLDISGEELTISLRVLPLPIEQKNSFIMKGDHQFGILMSHRDSIEFYIFDEKRISVKSKVDQNWYQNWHHVLGSYDGKHLKLYIDSILVNSTLYEGKIQNTPYPVCLGRNAERDDVGEHSGRLSRMILNEVMLFDRSVSIEDLDRYKDSASLRIDFENDQREGSFYAVGLGGRTYGLVWPDRRIQPELHQVKKSGQPIGIEVKDIDRGIFEVINWNLFTDLNEYDLEWEVSVDGKVNQQGTTVVSLPPLQEKEVKIPFQNTVQEEALLLLSFKTRTDKTWSGKGHEIAWEQFFLGTGRVPQATPQVSPGENSIQVETTQSHIRLKGASFTYEFDRGSGCFSSVNYLGKELPSLDPVFNLWRAPLANDIDPWGSEKYISRVLWPGLGRSIDNQLRTLGLDSLAREVESIEFEKNSDVSVTIKVRSSHGPESPDMKSFWYLFPASFQMEEAWAVHADGTLEYDLKVIPEGTMPEMFQKVGLQLTFPRTYSKVEWFGRGPFETYPDRKTGAKLGRYQSDVDMMYEPYLMPQDYGNRTEVSWLRVFDEEETGYSISGPRLLNFSFHKYSTDNLSRAYYTYQLIPSNYNYLNVDFEVSGVGETATRQLQKYRTTPDVSSYSITIRPFAER